MKRSFLPVLLASSALALAGCTDHSQDEKTVRALVTQFASAQGPHACDLLTADAVARIYGNGTPARGRPNCLAASKHFHSATIKITNVHFKDNTTAKVNATDTTGKTNYTVTAVKFGKRWRIDGITRG
jgi:hypothetical protein